MLFKTSKEIIVQYLEFIQKKIIMKKQQENNSLVSQFYNCIFHCLEIWDFITHLNVKSAIIFKTILYFIDRK